MKRRLAILTAAAFGFSSLGIAPAAIAVEQHTTRPSVTWVLSKSCAAGYVKGRIGGQTKCLRRGEYCSRRYKSQYRRYGFRCVWYHGAYRLR